jgi:putative transposase
VADLAELNRLFSAWVQVGYHQAVHSETGEPPLARWARGIPDPLALPAPAQLREAFLWSQRRTVTKTATVSLHGNLYQVDASLVRRVVELIFDPFDLTVIDVRHKGNPAGQAIPFLIGRHRHAKTRAGDGAQREQPEPTGIDYLRLLDAAHDAELKTQINYAALLDTCDDDAPGTDAPGTDASEQEDSRG